MTTDLGFAGPARYPAPRWRGVKLMVLLCAALVLASACDAKTMECKKACIAKMDECGEKTGKAARDACNTEQAKIALDCEQACGK